MLVNIKRITQPSIVKNTKELTYKLTQLSRTESQSLLSAPLAGGGVFGIEAYYSLDQTSLQFFAPPYYKTNWFEEDRCFIFDQLPKQDTLYIQPYLKKPSFFPIQSLEIESLIQKISTFLNKDLQIAYQILLVYRQDNWKDRLREQYEDYLHGIQLPATHSFIRKVQRNLNQTLDQFLQYEYQHAPIEETEQKIEENGFRFNVRLAVIGGTKTKRKQIACDFLQELNRFSYMNEWGMQTSFTFDDIIQNMRRRRLDNTGKHQVLSVSELLPFVMSESVIHIQQPTIVGKRSIAPRKSPFHLLPIGSSIKEVDGTVMAQKFIYALEEMGKVKEQMIAKRTKCGPTMMKVTFELPKGLRLSDMNKKAMIDDIQTFMGEKNIRITQGESIGEIDVWMPQEKRQKIFLKSYVDTKEFIEFADIHALPFFVGVNEIGEPIYQCLNKIRHILVAGTTGSGKSVWMNQLILTLLLIRSPEEVQFYMIDVKQVELTIYESFPHVHSVITDAEKSIHLLKQLIAEMHRRYSLFKEAQIKNIGLYNKKEGMPTLPYIVCVIDEYAELALQTEEVHELIQSLAQLSRAAGIHLVIATQDPRVEVIPGIIKSNLPGKIGLRCSNGNSYMTFLNTKPPFNLLGNGDGTMSFEGQMEEHIRFQGCLIIDDPHEQDLEAELIRTIAKSMERYEREGLPEVLEEEGIEESELDKLKRIIAQTGETRVSQLRDIMKININRLNELMKQLVDDRWLSRPETKQSGYQLIANQEELEKWKA